MGGGMTIDRELIERARQTDILAVAQRYATLKRAGGRNGKEFVGPCPVCGGDDRFAVNSKKQKWHCRGCSKGGGVVTLVEHVTGRSFIEAVELLTGEKWPRREITDQAPRAPSDGSDNAAVAGRIWRASLPIAGTVAERYLEVRGIDLGQLLDIDDGLRYRPACPFGEGTANCLVALVRDVVTDAPMAIMRTALDADARKLDRKALGPKRGGAIKLWSDASVTTGLVIGEGLETVAAAATRIGHNGTLLQPAWALIDAGNLAGFPVLPGIEALTILVDNDPVDPKTGKRPGQYAADDCTERWLAAGCDVEQLVPDRVGTDFNDIAHGGGKP